jgi:hypothetical protein
MIKLLPILQEIQIQTGISTDKIMNKLWIDLPDGEPTESWEEIVNLIYSKYKYTEGVLEYKELFNWVDSLSSSTKFKLYKDISNILDNDN